MSTRSVVHWECQAPDHRARRSRHGNGGLTIHDGTWAYCDGAGADDAHHWSPTGGVSLESLVRWTAPNGGAELVAPKDGTPTITVKRANGTPAKSSRGTSGVRRT
jgi:hypothetical protein